MKQFALKAWNTIQQIVLVQKLHFLRYNTFDEKLSLLRVSLYFNAWTSTATSRQSFAIKWDKIPYPLTYNLVINFAN
jgi:hypothetical protein